MLRQTRINLRRVAQGKGRGGETRTLPKISTTMTQKREEPPPPLLDLASAHHPRDVVNAVDGLPVPRPPAGAGMRKAERWKEEDVAVDGEARAIAGAAVAAKAALAGDDGAVGAEAEAGGAEAGAATEAGVGAPVAARAGAGPAPAAPAVAEVGVRVVPDAGVGAARARAAMGANPPRRSRIAATQPA
mmetsp:Transcript_36570/g.49472  ORF Transcript_36570/g.49472 Transcript_36570/m.49472 type:complete len:188 (-) Transcript_36570:462-1025(-)